MQTFKVNFRAMKRMLNWSTNPDFQATSDSKVPIVYAKDLHFDSCLAMIGSGSLHCWDQHEVLSFIWFFFNWNQNISKEFFYAHTWNYENFSWFFHN